MNICISLSSFPSSRFFSLFFPLSPILSSVFYWLLVFVDCAASFFLSEPGLIVSYNSQAIHNRFFSLLCPLLSTTKTTNPLHHRTYTIANQPSTTPPTGAHRQTPTILPPTTHKGLPTPSYRAATPNTRPNHHTFRPMAVHPSSATTNAPSSTTTPSHCFAQHHCFKSQPPHGTQTSFTLHCPKPPSCTVLLTTTLLLVFLPVSLQPVQHCFSYPINVENIYHFSPT
jgi:hypothetical protein